MIDGSKYSNEEIAAHDEQTKLLNNLSELVRAILMLDVGEVTEERLENLIAELLQEEQEKLDEFKITIKNKLPKANRQQIAKDLGLPVGDVKKVTGKTKLKPASQDWQDLAGLRSPAELEPKDFKIIP